jgi:hypothetical protein
MGAASAAPSDIEFGDGSHCVAYKVIKTMFLVSNSTVVGKNCDVSAQVLPEVGGLYHIEVNVPARSFKSGDLDRDKDVLEILRAKERPELTFRSKALNGEEWRLLFSKKEFPIEGNLYIGPNAFPITLQVEYKALEKSAEVIGRANVKFQDFAIKPPKVGGGLVAKSKPDFELHFHLSSTRILGADSIRL